MKMYSEISSRRVFLALTTAQLLMTVAHANDSSLKEVVPPPEVVAAMPGARLSGSAKLTFFGLEVYTARLWASKDATRGNLLKEPFALELLYAMEFKGALIAERSLQEMQKQEPVDDVLGEKWLSHMRRSFPDIKRGDRLVGFYMPVVEPNSAVRFSFNGKPTTSSSDAVFATRFFDIWLHPKTSEPAMRRSLLVGLP